jgi:hypothetical protein
MKTSKIFLLLSLIVVALIAAACGGNGSDANTTPNLSQTYTGETMSGDTLTVNYPEGWFQSGDADTGVTFSNVENMETIESGTVIEAGQMGVGVMVIAADMAGMFAGAGEISPMTLLTGFSSLMATSEDAPTMGEPAEITLNGKTGAVVSGDGESVAMTMMVMPHDSGAYIISFAATAPGELENARPTLEAVTNSVQYTPASGE